MNQDLGITEGSENVYADLGDPQAEEMHAKAEIVARISEIMDTKGMSCAQVAQMARWKAASLESVLKGRFRDTEEASLQQLLATLSN